MKKQEYDVHYDYCLCSTGGGLWRQEVKRLNATSIEDALGQATKFLNEEVGKFNFDPKEDFVLWNLNQVYDLDGKLVYDRFGRE